MSLVGFNNTMEMTEKKSINLDRSVEIIQTDEKRKRNKYIKIKINTHTKTQRPHKV